MVEDIREAGKGRVPGLAQAFAGMVGQVQGQGAIGAEEAQKIDQEPGRLTGGGGEQGGQFGGGKDQGWLLTEPDGVVARPRRHAEGRVFGVQGVELTEGVQEAISPGSPCQLGE